jgi:hypothetical protein
MKKEELRRQAEETNANLRARLMTELSRHIGQVNAIGMGELYVLVFGETWNHRINDTRKLRDLIEELRDEGVAISSSTANSGGGYYLPAAGSELADYLDGDEIRAFRILRRNRRIRKVSLREYWGQAGIRMEQYDAESQA